MRQRMCVLMGILVVAFALAVTPASAGAQWAVATSYTGVYLLNLDSGGLSNAMDTGLTGGSLGGVAIWNNYVFVADGTSGNGRLHIGQIDSTGLTPTINWLPDSVSLGALNNPSAVAVDATGGVYVISKDRISGAAGYHSYVGYLPSQGNTWASAGLNLFDMPTGFLSDIATTGIGSQALVSHRDARDPEDHWAGQTWISSVNSGGIANTNLPEDEGYYPGGIAAGTNGISYIANHPLDRGSISVIDSSSLQSIVTAAIDTGSFRPTDISFFSIGPTNYLGVVGTSQGANQAWRITLDANGVPLVAVDGDGSLSGGGVLAQMLDTSNEAFCTLSPDGKVFWVTSGNEVTALDTNTWTSVSVSVTGGPRYIAAFTPSDSPVPEPSSLLALLTGSVGLIGVLKRRRRP